MHYLYRLLLCLVMLETLNAAAQETTIIPGEIPSNIDQQLPLVFSDNFKSDNRDDYETTGNLSWDKRRLTLKEGSSVLRTINSGAWTKIELALEPVARDLQERASELQIRFQLFDQDDCYVRIRWRTAEKGGVIGSAALVDTQVTEEETTESVRREQSFEHDKLEKLSVSFRYGLMEVKSAEKRLLNAVSYIDGTNAACRSVRVSSVSGDARLTSFSVSALPQDTDETISQPEQEAESKARNAQITDLLNKGRFGVAAQMNEEELQFLKSRYPDHPIKYVAWVNSTAWMSQAAADYSRAESLYLEAISIWRNTVGDKHPYYANSVMNLAQNYGKVGELAKAESLYVEAKDIWENVAGKEFYNYAMCTTRLADFYSTMGETDRAEVFYLEAKVIWENLDGQENEMYAHCLGGLAGLHTLNGDVTRAVQLYTDMQSIYEQTLGTDHPAYAQVLRSLANIERSEGNFKKAEAIFLKAIPTLQAALGMNHPSCLDCQRDLAVVYQAMGDLPRAETLYVESFERRADLFRKVFFESSESAARAFLQHSYSGPDHILSVRRQLPNGDDANTYNISWRARELLGSILRFRQTRRDESPDTVRLRGDLRRVSKRLAQLTLAEFSSDQQSARRQSLQQFSEEKEKLERRLAATSAAFRRDQEIDQSSPSALIQHLPSEVAVVDIVQTAVSNWPASGNGDLQWSVEYDAFVLRRNRDGHSVDWLHLGPADAINIAVKDWLALINQGRGEATSSNHPAAILRKRLWEPLESHLRGVKHVVVIPDSATSFLPWAALPGSKSGTLLLEDYTLSTATSGQELYRQLTDPPSKNEELLLLGGVDYQSRGKTKDPKLTEDAGPTLLAHRSAAIDSDNRVQWKSLPGTANETNAISALWPNEDAIRMLSGAGANEDAAQIAMPGSKYVHLATHGFFADPKFRSNLQHDPKSEQLFQLKGFEMATAGRATVTGRNPLILSGVVLAGANLPPEKDELGLPSGADGIMTAQEVVYADLRDTELVTLSACDTGKGTQVAGGEGIYGLQRAFHLAGARHVVASLWKVDDQATAALMKLFYRNLWQEKQSPATALRNAQLTLLNHPDQIESLATTRGPNFNTTVRVTEDAATESDRKKSKRAPIRLWAAFTHSGPPAVNIDD